MKVFSILNLVVILFLLVGCNNIQNNKILVDLNYCVDGDTADFYFENDDYRFRFIGIDAPEIADDESYSIIAANYSCELLVNADKIEVEFDDNCDEEDKYGRKLVWVFVDDELLQSKVLKKGYAKVAYLYDDYKYISDLYKNENIAKKSKLGIWK